MSRRGLGVVKPKVKAGYRKGGLQGFYAKAKRTDEFDQGRLGHPRPKPTTVATTSWFLYEALHAQFLTDEERKGFAMGPWNVASRIRTSAAWALWAPGLTTLVLKSWLKWGMEQGFWQEVKERQGYIAKLTQEEQLKRHLQNDHVPFRKGCPVCVAAQGRQKSHWRASFTGVYAVSADIAGPFKPGRCWDPVASGRDKAFGYKYFLATAFTLPIKKRCSSSEEGPPPGKGKETPVGSQDTASPSPLVGQDLPGMADLFGEHDADDQALESEGAFIALKVVDRRLRSKKPEPKEPPPLPPPPEEPPSKGTRTLFMGVPLRSRRGKEVMGAVQKVVNQLGAYSFPVHRFHADRAKELRSAGLVSWLRQQGLPCTWTPGESPARNKAELDAQISVASCCPRPPCLMSFGHLRSCMPAIGIGFRWRSNWGHQH